MSGHELCTCNHYPPHDTGCPIARESLTSPMHGVSTSEAAEGLSTFAHAARPGAGATIGEPVKVDFPPPTQDKPSELHPGVPSLIDDAIETALDDLRFLRTDIANLQKKEAPLCEYLTELKKLRERLCQT